MILQLVDVLRCPSSHEDSHLVLTADAWRDGAVTAGRLGCPVCRMIYPIVDGVADFTAGATPWTGGATNRPAVDAWRLAAQLDLQSPGGIVLLAGAYARAAASLRSVVDVTAVLVGADVVPHGAVALGVAGRLPLATGALLAAAVEAGPSSGAWLEEVARVVRPGGRIVAPATAPVPGGVALVARDETEWVAEASSAPVLLPLRKRRD